jgi:hypothetical protein
LKRLKAYDTGSPNSNENKTVKKQTTMLLKYAFKKSCDAKIAVKFINVGVKTNFGIAERKATLVLKAVRNIHKTGNTKSSTATIKTQTAARVLARFLVEPSE